MITIKWHIRIADQINFDIFVMAMRHKTLAVFQIKQPVAHAVSSCKTNLKHHDALDIEGKAKSLAISHTIATIFSDNYFGL